MRLRHPHILPTLEIEVADTRVAAHVAAGWLPVSPPDGEAAPPVTTERPRRNRRAGSDLPKETAT